MVRLDTLLYVTGVSSTNNRGPVRDDLSGEGRLPVGSAVVGGWVAVIDSVEDSSRSHGVDN